MSFSESSGGRPLESLIAINTIIKYRNSMNNNNVTIDCHMLDVIPTIAAVKNTFTMCFK